LLSAANGLPASAAPADRTSGPQLTDAVEKGLEKAGEA
jgi:hypothetical protein